MPDTYDTVPTSKAAARCILPISLPSLLVQHIVGVS